MVEVGTGVRLLAWFSNWVVDGCPMGMGLGGGGLLSFVFFGF